MQSLKCKRGVVLSTSYIKYSNCFHKIFLFFIGKLRKFSFSESEKISVILMPLLLSSYRTMVTLFTHKPVHIYKCYIVYLLISRISEVRVCVKWILCALLPWHAIYIYTINMYVRCWLLHSKHVRLRNISTPSSSAGCSFVLVWNEFIRKRNAEKEKMLERQSSYDRWLNCVCCRCWLNSIELNGFFFSLSLSGMIQYGLRFICTIESSLYCRCICEPRRGYFWEEPARTHLKIRVWFWL